MEQADEPLFPLFVPAPTNQDGQESVSQPETVTGRRDGPERDRGIGPTGYDHWSRVFIVGVLKAGWGCRFAWNSEVFSLGWWCWWSERWDG